MTGRHNQGNRGNGLARSYDGIPGLSVGLDRVREVARKDSSTQFTALLHHITVEMLIHAYRQLKKNAAAGVDGVTWREYEPTSIQSIRALHKRVQNGTYRAKPSKRLYLEKEDGRKRPIGIAALEDKIVQQAMVWVLQAIYEESFMGFSYGFRPGRKQHDALDAVAVSINRKRVNWILDADIQGFFDTIDHDQLMAMLEARIQDRRVLRIIAKWLTAGVSEDGEWSKTTVGTPQGAVISPMLANIYLHHVLDRWVHTWRNESARGEVYIVRYADDFVMGFQYRDDAVRCREALAARLAEYNLTLHPEKTRLIEFGRFAAKDRNDRGDGKPETFVFLGFRHICGRTRKGHFVVQRKTDKKKMRTKLKEVKAKLRKKMHDPVEEQGRWLARVLRGHMNYFGVPMNRGPHIYAHEVGKIWYRILRRRSQKGKRLKWNRMLEYIKQYLPKITVCHPYPEERFCV